MQNREEESGKGTSLAKGCECVKQGSVWWGGEEGAGTDAL